MASAFWWASHMVARLLSTELSLFPFWGTPLLKEWGLLDGALPWLQMPIPPSTLSGLLGRTAPLQVVLVPQEETLEVCAVCKPPGIVPVVLPWKFLAPPAEWWVCPPLGSAEANSAESLSGQSIPPLSTLWLLHAGTSHALLPHGEGCLLHIRLGSRGRALHPLLAPFLRLASTHQWPAA